MSMPCADDNYRVADHRRSDREPVRPRVVLAWIGFGKFAKMEARVLIEHSPLMSWIYDFLSVGAVAECAGYGRDRRRGSHRASAGVA